MWMDRDQNITLEQQIFIEIGQLLKICIAETSKAKRTILSKIHCG